MKSILILGAGRGQKSVIGKALEMGLRVIAADGNSEAQSLSLASKSLIFDIRKAEEVYQAAKHEQVDAIYPAVDAAVIAASEAALLLNLPALSAKAAQAATDKIFSRNTLAENLKHKPAVPPLIPRFFELDEDLSDVYIQKELASWGYPIVVKPSDNRGSRGVVIVNESSELKKAIDEARSFSTNKKILIEEFMSGDEVSVEALVYKGYFYPLAITGKVRTPLPYRLDTTIFMPANLKAREEFLICKSLQQILEALDFVNGTVHAEFILNSNNACGATAGPKLVEIMARLGGGAIATFMVEYMTGIDFIKSSLQISLDYEEELIKHLGKFRFDHKEIKENLNFDEKGFISKNYLKDKAAAQVWFQPKAGLIKAIYGLEEARESSGVVEINLDAKPGETIKPFTNSIHRDAVGYAITVAKNSVQALALANQAISKVSFEIAENVENLQN